MFIVEFNLTADDYLGFTEYFETREQAEERMRSAFTAACRIFARGGEVHTMDFRITEVKDGL